MEELMGGDWSCWLLLLGRASADAWLRGGLLNPALLGWESPKETLAVEVLCA
jgi:hypothetical protein